ncbi:MAG: type VII secretion protein EccCb [Carbonactinosporaceae bacterium]
MSHVIVHRPARSLLPRIEGFDLAVSGPPQTPAATSAGPASYLQYMLPAVGSLGSLVFILANNNPLFIAGGILFAATAILIGIALAVQQRSSAAFKRYRDRVRYLEYLDDLRGQLREAASTQVADGRDRHPAPEALWQVPGLPPRLWERRRTDPDFLEARVGVGDVPLAARLRLETSSGPLTDTDPVCREEAERLANTSATLPDQPVTVRLAEAGTVCVRGPRTQTRALVRALLAGVAAWQAPEDVRVAVSASSGTVGEWTWIKWLPHAHHPEARDATGTARLFSGQPGELRTLLLPEFEARQRRRAQPRSGDRPAHPGGHLIVVIDRDTARPGTGDTALDTALASAKDLAVTVVHLVDTAENEPSQVDLRLAVDSGGSLAVTPGTSGGASGRARADQLSSLQAEALARRLAPLRLSPQSAEAPDAARGVDLPKTLGFDPDTLDPRRSWVPRTEPEWLRVPVGTAPDGRIVHLDLKESARGGMGPHGLLVGATGSGKSELLRTLVVSLVATHAPDRLNFVLVDFKGGATFAGLADLPHVAGMITNLEDEPTLVDRFRDALDGEMRRRQRMLRAAGNYSSARDYEAARAAGAALEPMPSLVVIVDEFSELLSAKPDFIDMFVALGRVGRSLGMHLLLASQRLEEGRLRGLESHLSYRLALRTFSSTESRAVLGVPDAYELPPIPGSGYLKVDTSVFERFRAAYVSAPLPREREEVPSGPESSLLPYTASNFHLPEDEVPAFQPAEGDEPSVLDDVVTRLRRAGRRAHQVWLPPLETPPTLDELVSAVGADPVRGLVGTGWAEHGRMRAPIGIVDRPREQSREYLIADLSGAGGNVGVVGGTRSGKTTALRTLVGALALTHTPAEVQFYCLDFGGGGLVALEALPHVGTVATRLEPELVRRLVAELATLLEEREQRFRKSGIDSMTTMRAWRAAGRLPDETRGDVVLVLDGWPRFRRDFEDLEPVVMDLASRGLGYGIHVVLTTNRWFDVKPALKDTLGTRLELRIGDPIESEIDRRAAANVPADRPGRGLTADKLHCQVGLPRIDGVPADDDLSGALADFGKRSAAAWGAPPAPPVRVLPPRVVLSELPAPGADTRPGVPVGVGELELTPAYVDLTGPDPHFLLFGEGQSGKTTLLRTFLMGLVQRATPDEARVVVVDYRRTLLGAIEEPHLLAYAGAAPALDAIVADLHGSLTRRLPGPDVTPRQLRERSWWSGPQVYLVVDDHDLVVTPTSNPLGPLVDLLAQARDIGLHLILARRVGGAGRAAFEPVIQRLKELATPGVILSGDRAEGAVLGPYRASEQPPGRGLFVSRNARVQLIQVATDL